MVDQGLLDEPVFTIYLSKHNDNDSEIMFGGIDKERYNDKLYQLPVHRKTYWEADFDAIFFGSQTAKLDNTGALFVIGTPLIALPMSLAHNFNQEIGAKRGEDGQFFVDCSRRESLPDLTFTLAGRNFTLDPFEYILKVESGCISSLIGLDVPSPTGPVTLLGVPLLRKWYSIYDLGSEVVGLAKAR